MDKPLQKDVCKEEVYARMHHRYAKDLHNFIYFKFGQAFDPADKVQEAFIKLWDNCEKVSPDKVKSYLFTIANNLSLNEAKHNQVKFKYAKLTQKETTQESPEYLLEEKQFYAKYERALAKLPEGQRVVFLMNRVEGKKMQEIATLLSLSKKAIEKRLYAAIRTLQKEIKGIR